MILMLMVIIMVICPYFGFSIVTSGVVLYLVDSNRPCMTSLRLGQPIGLSEWAGPNNVLNLALVIRAVALSGFEDQVEYEEGQKETGEVAES